MGLWLDPVVQNICVMLFRQISFARNYRPIRDRVGRLQKQPERQPCGCQNMTDCSNLDIEYTGLRRFGHTRP